MKALNYIAALSLFVIASSAFAQEPTKASAHKLYLSAVNNDNVDSLMLAKDQIDAVVLSDVYSSDPEVWLIHGHVYKDLFKVVDKTAPTSKSRLQALESFYRCYELSQKTENRVGENARQGYEYLATTLFNDAAKALNDLDAELAQALFDDYKKAERKMFPDKNLAAKEIEFKNALGTLYTKKMRMEKDLKWFHEATRVYEDVLLIDPENYGANYNMATLYYNRGVQNIFNISPDNDIPSIKKVQIVSKEYFIQSMPYMLKAHELKPKRKETLIGLEGIYYSLQDWEKSEYFSNLYKELVKEEKQGSE